MGLLEAHAALRGKVAVVVGGAGEIIGRAVTLGLAEAGVNFVTIDLSNHGASGTWDTHGDNIPPYGGIMNGLRPLLPVFDHLLTTLVTDLGERNLLDDVLVLEAKVQPKDIAFIHPGQGATVKFTAYDFSIYGGLPAEVENISPDTVTGTGLAMVELLPSWPPKLAPQQRTPPVLVSAQL